MTESRSTGRMTQRRIAELAGVSQTTVSLVLNSKADALSRIPAETRERVLQVILDAQYVADPAARRLAGVGNKIIGVFTYEHAFPTQSLDFYTPLLTGVEAAAEQAGCDLLMFTSAPVIEGHRQIFHENNRLGLADGCLLLGREMEGGELIRLVESGFPFVAIGRRDSPVEVPYVGVDYVNATAELVRRSLDAGHRDLYYLHLDGSGESVLDRQAGFARELMDSAARFTSRATDGSDLHAAWEEIRLWRPTVLFVEDAAHARVLHKMFLDSNVQIPEELSMVVLGELARIEDRDIDFTRMSPPRIELGSRAVEMLVEMLTPGPEVGERQILLPCPVTAGSTLTAPGGDR